MTDQPEPATSGDTPLICSDERHQAKVADLVNRLRLAHQTRRAKEHQLDDIRRALCDVGAMQDDDPYSHADLADVIRQAGPTGAMQAASPDAPSWDPITGDRTWDEVKDHQFTGLGDIVGFAELAADGQQHAQQRAATLASDMCPRCKGDNSEEYALCGTCEAADNARTTPDNPAASSDGADDGLREQYAKAARIVKLRLGPNAIGMAQRGEPIILNGNEADALADAVLAVRDRRMEQLAAWLSAESAHHHAAVPLCRIPEAGQAHDGMGAGLDIAAHAVAGLIAGRGLPVSGGVKPAGEAPASGHGETPGDGDDGR